MTSLETERLVLRAFREEDLDAYAALFADPEVNRFLGPPLDRAGAWRSMAVALGHLHLRGFSQSAVVEKGSRRVIGRGGLWRPEGWPGLEVGWVLARDVWGQGYATELGAACRDYAFTVLDAEWLYSLIHPDNASSVAVALRIGHHHLGRVEINGKQCLLYGQQRPSGADSIAARRRLLARRSALGRGGRGSGRPQSST